jgi:hypothetical protein
MICAECQDRLSELIDGTLGERKRAAVDEHLRGCPRCQALRDDLAQIILASSNLPMHSPPSAVWIRVEREIGSSAPSWWARAGARRFSVSFTGRQLASAAAALLIFASCVTVLYVAAPHTLPTMSASWGAFQGKKGSVAPVMLSTSAPLPSKAAVEEMQRAIELKQASWSDELRAAYGRGLAAADQRISECERAEQAAPGDASHADATLAAYREKLRFLEQFGDLHE